MDAAWSTAKGAQKLVFVDAWAPWCHSCLSMQRDVLHDSSLNAYADRLVFAAVDTDKPEAASFTARFAMASWPTFFVIDPANDAVLAQHGGSMSLVELRAFLDGALRTLDPAQAASPEVKALLLGHAATRARAWSEAAQHYQAAAAQNGPGRADAVLGAMRSLSAQKDHAACVAYGVQVLPTLQRAVSSADVASYLMSCAEQLADPAQKTAAVTAARARLIDLTDNAPAGASVDDRADALALLADAAESLGDVAAHKQAHEKRLALLEADANAQTTVEAARVHDYARLNSYIALGRGDDAVALFQQRTEQLPQSYEAWARLASALHQTKQDARAAPAVERAVALSYGPRRLRYRVLQADIALGLHDVTAERAALTALAADVAALPQAQRDEPSVKSISEAAAARLTKLGGAAPVAH